MLIPHKLKVKLLVRLVPYVAQTDSNFRPTSSKQRHRTTKPNTSEKEHPSTKMSTLLVLQTGSSLHIISRPGLRKKRDYYPKG